MTGVEEKDSRRSVERAGVEEKEERGVQKQEQDNSESGCHIISLTKAIIKN